jgi:predicted dinucleotide-utilizing enzyme
VAVSDYRANINFAAGDSVMHPGDRIEVDVVADDEWEAVVDAGWISSATTNATDDPNPTVGDGWEPAAP